MLNAPCRNKIGRCNFSRRRQRQGLIELFGVRVGYVKPMDHSIPIEVATPVLSCKTFIPQRRRGDYENITEVVAKAQEHIERSSRQLFYYKDTTNGF